MECMILRASMTSIRSKILHREFGDRWRRWLTDLLRLVWHQQLIVCPPIKRNPFYTVLDDSSPSSHDYYNTTKEKNRSWLPMGMNHRPMQCIRSLPESNIVVFEMDDVLQGIFYRGQLVQEGWIARNFFSQRIESVVDRFHVLIRQDMG